MDDWKKRHDEAMRAPRPGHELAIVRLLRGYEEMARAHRAEYGEPIGDDGYFGPSWFVGLMALKDALNGELGRLDGGELSRVIGALARENQGWAIEKRLRHEGII